MTRFTKEQLDEIRKKAEESGNSGIKACKNAVGLTDYVGLSTCEDVNPSYLQGGPVKSLSMELDKALQGFSDPNYILEKVRLTTCHLADVYRMTALEAPLRKACDALRNTPGHR
jgi:hypothetical protein